MLAMTAPRLRPRWELLRDIARRSQAGDVLVPGRRVLQVSLAVVWLLDAALQYQPFMFGPFFVTQGIQPATAGSPAVVSGSVIWASQIMLRHIAVYNAIFATIQLLIAVGILVPRTCKPALAASIVWALSVWWFGESLGGIFAGASPLAGLPGGVVLYALIAVLLWPTATVRRREAASPATAGPLGARGASLLWLIVWGSFCYSLLLPANRSAGAISQIFSVTDGQPGWLAAIMNALAGLAGQRGLEISVLLAVFCAVAGIGVLRPRFVRPAVLMAAALGLLFWVAEGLGGIFTGQGTDPNTGLLLVLLAACFWPRTRQASAPATYSAKPRAAEAPGLTRAAG
jgi:hypothetical protein